MNNHDTRSYACFLMFIRFFNVENIIPKNTNLSSFSAMPVFRRRLSPWTFRRIGHCSVLHRITVVLLVGSTILCFITMRVLCDYPIIYSQLYLRGEGSIYCRLLCDRNSEQYSPILDLCLSVWDSSLLIWLVGNTTLQRFLFYSWY